MVNKLGLKNMHCDSCGAEVDYLFPVATIQELPTGGEEMVLRYYCKDCYDIMLDNAGEELDEKEEEENKESFFECVCCESTYILLENEDKKDYFCYGCKKYICDKCKQIYRKFGKTDPNILHTIKNHKEACKQQGMHD